MFLTRHRLAAARAAATVVVKAVLRSGAANTAARALGPARDRREMTLRLQRRFLTAAAEGYPSRAAVADFERCLQLGGTDLRDDELFATFVALVGYYALRADLRRIAQVFESLA